MSNVTGFITLLVVLLALGAQGNVLKTRLNLPDLENPRIVGGKDTDIESVPYQVSVRMLGSHICGGSIFSSRIVVTAAHCIYSFLGASYYSIQYGSTNVGGVANVIDAERLLKHENYDSSAINNDVALIFLTSDIKFGASAKPIALAKQPPAPGTKAIVSGWGTLEENGVTPLVLQSVHVNIVDRDTCGRQYATVNEITQGMLCAAVPQGGKDACQGDSGGPLVADGKLVGIVSWGVGCARSDFSGVYTNVSEYAEWIEKNVA